MKGKLILILSVTVLNVGCFRLYDCGEEVVKEFVSPDGKYTATIFERNCGATTSFVAHINLRKSDKEFEKDNLNRIEEGYIKTPDTIENLTVKWQDNKTLKIKCPSCDYKHTNWNDVDVIYSE